MWTDAHCHPTDTPSNLAEIENLGVRMACMSTRFDDLALVDDIAISYPEAVVPAFGLHPWYSHLLKIDSTMDKKSHYASVFQSEPSVDQLNDLPEPVSLESHMNILENYLKKHSNALVGEVGLDRAFRVRINGQLSQLRVKLTHQITVLEAQLALAARFHRSVSLHGVQAHMPLYESVSKFASELSAVGLHAYAGSPELLTHYWLKLPAAVYVSISTLINGKAAEKVQQAVVQVPVNRIMSESDYHEAGAQQLSLVKDSVDWLHQAYSQAGLTPPTAGLIEANFSQFIGK